MPASPVGGERLVKAACPRCENLVKRPSQSGFDGRSASTLDSVEPLEGVPTDLCRRRRQPAAAPAAVRLAIVDSDSGFVRVLAKRVGAVGWRAEVLASPPPVEELPGMRQHAIVIDLAVLGSEAWAYLGQPAARSSLARP